MILLSALLVLVFSLTPDQLNTRLSQYIQDQEIMGLSLQITKNSSTIYQGNFGYRNYDKKLPVNNATRFRVASLSKNVAAVGLYQLIEQGKLLLTDSLTDALGFSVVNPFYPNIAITVEMLLSHQSTIEDCSTVYDPFLVATDLAQNITILPQIKDLFTPGSKYYNNCTFRNQAPGTHYSYTNLGYILVGNIIEKVTNNRFDTWMRNNYLKNIGSPSYNPADLPDLNDLAVLYHGLNNVWVPLHDDYNGKFVDKDLTGYVPGTNAAIYGPHAHLRATTDQLLQHINLIRQKGRGVLKQTSVKDIIHPRYQYRGQQFGAFDDWHYYGFGLHTTGYYTNDIVLNNKVVVGHTGSGYGLISALYYSGQYAFAFAINGILHGYTYSNNSIYQVQRQYVFQAVDQFINTN